VALAYGKEPIPLLQALAKDYGFELKLYPVPPSQMQNQTSLWLDVRRDRPDWIYMQGWGAMNPTALKEAAKVSFPMDHVARIAQDQVAQASPQSAARDPVDLQPYQVEYGLPNGERQ